MYHRIRDLREDGDYTQSELANYLNCSQVCYSYYEIGAQYGISESSARVIFFRAKAKLKKQLEKEGL